INITQSGKSTSIVGSNLGRELILLFSFCITRFRSPASSISFGYDGILFANWWWRWLFRLPSAFDLSATNSALHGLSDLDHRILGCPKDERGSSSYVANETSTTGGFLG